MSDLDERLLAMYSHRGDGLPTQYVNPDGPEAFGEITALRREVANLKANGIHTCHADWQRPLCVAQRENAALRERVAVLTGLIRECRLADAYAARTGDESRWGRAFDALCRAERIDAHLLTPESDNG